MLEESISLSYRDNKSDKVYHAQLVARDDGFVVLVQYGRRGGTLAQQTKTPAPVSYATAKKEFDKVVREKLAKGYSPGESGAAFTGGALEARFTGVVPQLLNPIDEVQAEQLIADPDWVAQEKHDGHRRLVRRTGDSVTGINRKGLTTGLPAPVAQVLAALPWADFVVDGELMGDTLALFDVLELEGRDLRAAPYDERLGVLDALDTQLGEQAASHAFVVRTARTEAEKRALYEALEAAKAEGVVFKLAQAPYVAGKPASGGSQLKRVFLHRASFLVDGAHPTRRSVSLQLLDEAGAPVLVGNCTVPANHAIPAPGAIVDVEYLYAFPGGSVFQPRYKGERDDIEASACRLGQLHYKRGTTDEDDEGNDTSTAA